MFTICINLQTPKTHRTWICISWRDGRAMELPQSGRSRQLGVRCLAQGHLDSAQEVNWHLFSYQSTLHTVDLNRPPSGPKVPAY